MFGACEALIAATTVCMMLAAIDCVGENLSHPTLTEFVTNFCWKKKTGKAMTSYSTTRWWCKWEAYKATHEFMIQFGDMG